MIQGQEGLTAWIQQGKDLVPKVKDEIYKFETILNDGLSMDDQRLMKKMLIKMIRNMKGSSDLL